MGELDGKVVLLTGAAQGLGAASRAVMEREGAIVVATDRTEDTGLHSLDVTREEDWQRVVDSVIQAHGRIDVLVNNAGITGARSIPETSTERWNSYIAVMQTGPFLGMRAVLPLMAAAGRGSVVNVASLDAHRGRANAAAYVSAKHGVMGLTRSAALEYAATGVRVNAVCPGTMLTPMLQGSFADLDGLAAQLPNRRLADPSEIAEVISFLASDRSSYCVGASIVVDGGWSVGHGSFASA